MWDISGLILQGCQSLVHAQPVVRKYRYSNWGTLLEAVSCLAWAWVAPQWESVAQIQRLSVKWCKNNINFCYGHTFIYHTTQRYTRNSHASLSAVKSWRDWNRNRVDILTSKLKVASCNTFNTFNFCARFWLLYCPCWLSPLPRSLHRTQKTQCQSGKMKTLRNIYCHCSGRTRTLLPVGI